MEGIFDLFWGIDDLQLHLGDHQSGLIGIEKLLQKVAGLVLDFDTGHGQDVFDRGPANDTAQADFSGITQGLIRIGNAEQIRPRRLSPDIARWPAPQRCFHRR